MNDNFIHFPDALDFASDRFTSFEEYAKHLDSMNVQVLFSVDADSKKILDVKYKRDSIILESNLNSGQYSVETLLKKSGKESVFADEISKEFLGDFDQEQNVIPFVDESVPDMSDKHSRLDEKLERAFLGYNSLNELSDNISNENIDLRFRVDKENDRLTGVSYLFENELTWGSTFQEGKFGFSRMKNDLGIEEFKTDDVRPSLWNVKENHFLKKDLLEAENVNEIINENPNNIDSELVWAINDELINAKENNLPTEKLEEIKAGVFNFADGFEGEIKIDPNLKPFESEIKKDDVKFEKAIVKPDNKFTPDAFFSKVAPNLDKNKNYFELSEQTELVVKGKKVQGKIRVIPGIDGAKSLEIYTKKDITKVDKSFLDGKFKFDKKNNVFKVLDKDLNQVISFSKEQLNMPDNIADHKLTTEQQLQLLNDGKISDVTFNHDNNQFTADFTYNGEGTDRKVQYEDASKIVVNSNMIHNKHYVSEVTTELKNDTSNIYSNDEEKVKDKAEDKKVENNKTKEKVEGKKDEKVSQVDKDITIALDNKDFKKVKDICVNNKVEVNDAFFEKHIFSNKKLESKDKIIALSILGVSPKKAREKVMNSTIKTTKKITNEVGKALNETLNQAETIGSKLIQGM